MIDRGLRLYRQHCVRCHGAPGIAPADFARGMTPGAPPLAQVAREWTPEEMYLAVRSGIKMTGMPAWKYRLRDSEIWDVVAFLRALPGLSPADYCARAPGRACERTVQPPRVATTDSGESGDAARGEIAVRQYGCDSCHRIPGIVGPDAAVGPPLDNMAQRIYIAGLLLNTPENMSLWIRHPQAVKPLAAMPELGVSERDARDIAAYLRTLD
jgi:mono/diheme cytochrome c family protein